MVDRRPNRLQTWTWTHDEWVITEKGRARCITWVVTSLKSRMSIWRTLWIFIFDGRPNRVNNVDIRVVILKLTHYDYFFITSHKTAHLRNTWHSYHLHLIFPAVVPVTREESASIPIDLIRKTTHFIRKPLTKTHWSRAMMDSCSPWNYEETSMGVD